MTERFPGIDWYCDVCGAFLNEQEGFNDSMSSWSCTECGCDNSITEEDIIYDTDESIGVWEAAQIWESNGRDEDYTFGYSIEELEDAL